MCACAACIVSMCMHMCMYVLCSSSKMSAAAAAAAAVMLVLCFHEKILRVPFFVDITPSGALLNRLCAGQAAHFFLC